MVSAMETDVLEVWRAIPGYPDYEASNLGQIRRATPHQATRVGRILQGEVTRTGYHRVLISSRRPMKHASVHRLVALTFLGEPNGLEVNHINGKKLDNHLSNLEYVTRSENHIHAVETGLKPMRGEKNSWAKLDEERVRIIRRMVNQGVSHRKTARAIGVSPSAVSKIASGVTWRHVL